ncbi:hypothetical protein EST38_g14076 [Candolleomyces aberdarensis]|uniref:Uncharacterized protein n=1 Tax=Candolleomyces aberdarensis TaxID=2316362 RepID=A0A4Q2CZ70_9AGAR|nr:hypothetical protein EST38_g14076 [Candolleomyces aberdarensis]
MRNDDETAVRLACDAQTYALRSGVITVRCALIGSQCSKIHFVPVPVDNGYHAAPRPIDLKYELFLHVEQHSGRPVVDLDRFMVEYAQFPLDAVATTSKWTIFNSSPVRFSDSCICFVMPSYFTAPAKAIGTVNTLIKTFHGADAIKDEVRGTYLVVKSDSDGVACDVRQEDIQIIRDLIVQCFDRNYATAPHMSTIILNEKLFPSMSLTTIPLMPPTPRVSRAVPTLNVPARTSLPLTPDDPPNSTSLEEISKISRSLARILTTKQAFARVTYFRDADVFYNVPEMRSTILSFCDHFTVMAVSRVNSDGRRSAQAEMRIRVRLVVSPFIARDCFDDFLEMLDETRAIIVGSVARRLLNMNCMFLQDMPDVNRYTICGDLNFIVPKGQRVACQRWLTVEGFGFWGDNSPHTAFKTVAHSFVNGYKSPLGITKVL